MANKVWKSDYFYGHEISNYGKENGYVDYETLAKAVGDMVLNNNIIRYGYELGLEWELVHGEDYDEEENRYCDIYQYYIIRPVGVEVLEMWTDEIVYYNEAFDMYLWGITHFGTSWDYVLTDIKLEKEGDE